MIKKFYNKNVLRAMGAVLMVCLMAIGSFGQTAPTPAVGDYGSGASGNYGTIGTWVICASAGTWTGATAAAAAPGAGNNVFIRAGNTVTLDASAKSSKNLVIENTASLVAGSTATIASPFSFRIGTGATTVHIDGTLGGTVNPAPGISLEIQGTNNTVTLQGSGTLSICRVRESTSTSTGNTMKFNINATLLTTNQSISTNSATNSTFEISAGKTVTSSGFISVNTSGSADPAAAANLTINVYGTLNATTASTSGNLNLRNFTGGTTTFNVYKGGSASFGGILVAPSGSTASAMNLKIEEGGSLTVGGAGGTTDASGLSVEYATAATGSTGASITAPTFLTTIKNLNINNTGGVTLGSATTVSGALTLTSGNLTLGANDLTVGSITGGSTLSHVVTDGTGYLKSAFVGGDTKTFPIGASATSYDPLSIKPTNPVTFSARVKAALSNVAGVSDPTLILKKEWDLSPSATPGSTDLAFTADAASLNGSGGAFIFPAAGAAILGHWNSVTGVYDANITASFSSRTWTVAGYTGSFSPFIAAAPGAVLSIDLQNLAVKSRGTTNIVSWATASEKNNAAFNIERSADGQDFTTIGTVKGNGTKNTSSDYTFSDFNPINGINYYRLRSVDMDGKATLSKSVAIVTGKTTTGIVKAYPSVSTAVLTVDVVIEGASTLNIIDLTGKTVLTKTIKDTGFSSHPIDVSGFPNGLYVLMFTSASVQMVQKFVKN